MPEVPFQQPWQVMPSTTAKADPVSMCSSWLRVVSPSTVSQSDGATPASGNRWTRLHRRQEHGSASQRTLCDKRGVKLLPHRPSHHCTLRPTHERPVRPRHWRFSTSRPQSAFARRRLPPRVRGTSRGTADIGHRRSVPSPGEVIANDRRDAVEAGVESTASLATYWGMFAHGRGD